MGEIVHTKTYNLNESTCIKVRLIRSLNSRRFSHFASPRRMLQTLLSFPVSPFRTRYNPSKLPSRFPCLLLLCFYRPRVLDDVVYATRKERRQERCAPREEPAQE